MRKSRIPGSKQVLEILRSSLTPGEKLADRACSWALQGTAKHRHRSKNDKNYSSCADAEILTEEVFLMLILHL